MEMRRIARERLPPTNLQNPSQVSRCYTVGAMRRRCQVMSYDRMVMPCSSSNWSSDSKGGILRNGASELAVSAGLGNLAGLINPHDRTI